MPIMVVYSGDELTPETMEMFRTSWEDVQLMNIDRYVDEQLLGGLKGFQIKPFALFFSPFQVSRICPLT